MVSLKGFLVAFFVLISMSVPAFSTYVGTPGDTLEVKVVGHDELSSKQTITPDGTISLPLLGRMAVQNKTLSELDSIIGTGFSKYVKTPQITVALAQKDTKEVPQYFVVLHDLKKDSWEVKSLKTVSEAWAWTNGRQYQVLRNGQKVETQDIQAGDSLLVSFSKAPDFFEENWYKLLTAAGVVTGIYLGLNK